MTKSGTNRTGRPTKAPKEGERVSLGLRVTADMKRRLDAAATRNGRSQSQEAEFRLARSFSIEDDRGGAEEAALASLIAGAFLRGGQQAARLKWQPFGEKPGAEAWQKQGALVPANIWSNDPQCFAQACTALIYMLDMIAPSAPDEAVTEIAAEALPSMADIAGQVTANKILAEILGDWRRKPVADERPSDDQRQTLRGATGSSGNG